MKALGELRRLGQAVRSGRADDELFESFRVGGIQSQGFQPNLPGTFLLASPAEPQPDQE